MHYKPTLLSCPSEYFVRSNPWPGHLHGRHSSALDVHPSFAHCTPIQRSVLFQALRKNLANTLCKGYRYCVYSAIDCPILTMVYAFTGFTTDLLWPFLGGSRLQ